MAFNESQLYGVDILGIDHPYSLTLEEALFLTNADAVEAEALNERRGDFGWVISPRRSRRRIEDKEAVQARLEEAENKRKAERELKRKAAKEAERKANEERISERNKLMQYNIFVRSEVQPRLNKLDKLTMLVGKTLSEDEKGILNRRLERIDIVKRRAQFSRSIEKAEELIQLIEDTLYCFDYEDGCTDVIFEINKPVLMYSVLSRISPVLGKLNMIADVGRLPESGVSFSKQGTRIRVEFGQQEDVLLFTDYESVVDQLISYNGRALTSRLLNDERRYVVDVSATAEKVSLKLLPLF